MILIKNIKIVNILPYLEMKSFFDNIDYRIWSI